MTHSLHHRLAELVSEWREQGYPSDYPALSSILRFASETDGDMVPYLRRAQVRALETYWYIRAVRGTPKILDLYRGVYAETVRDLIDGLAIEDELFKQADYQLDRLLEMVREDDGVVKQCRLNTLREAISLDYPSYILALAMGAGKTVLIGAIIASEFALALDNEDGPFIRNAMVFAPGKAIIESLRELTQIPYERILPPRHHKRFISHMRIVFTRDGEKHIPVGQGTSYNIVVTNTEKIRIQKEKIKKAQVGQFEFARDAGKAREEVANARLQLLASLPALGIFSDEAHHTYGQALGTELKKVRKTVDYLSQKTDVVCVVNTTGTPYFQRQPLREVVVWYGLSEGINDGILKEVAQNIEMYDFEDNQSSQFVTHVVEDFFEHYGDVRLPNGASAKLAIYFPQTDDLAELRPAIEAKLTELGYSSSICMSNTTKSGEEEKEAFNRLNHPESPHRVILLVNIGTEGWNCPSLFACALARELRSSNNFVLQAASRCLRAVPGDNNKAKIYLSKKNFATLNRELKNTYGESVSDIRRVYSKPISRKIEVRKPSVPPLVIRRAKRTYTRKKGVETKFKLTKPKVRGRATMYRMKAALGDLAQQARALLPVGTADELGAEEHERDVYAASVELSTVYRVDYWSVHDQIAKLYPNRRVPESHMSPLAVQIEEQTSHYDVKEEYEDHALALVKPQGFDAEELDDGKVIYTAEIRYPIDKEHLLLSLADTKRINPKEFSFHYDPYLFDSVPERSYLENVLSLLKVKPKYVEDIFFTGGLTDPGKTDFFVEYRGEDGRWHRYTPDFVIRRKDGKHLIVEVKSDRFEAAVKQDIKRARSGSDPLYLEGRKAVALKKWEHLNPKKIKYELVFTQGEDLPSASMKATNEFVERVK